MPVTPYRSRLLLPRELPFTDAKERRWFYNYRGAGSWMLFDSFNRADSATSLGMADTGQVWQAITGTWGISGNRAYNPSATADAFAVVDAGVADCSVEVKLAVLSTSCGLYLRVTDALNWIRVIRDSAVLRLQKRVANSTSTPYSVGQAFADGDVLRVVLSGSTISFAVNGVAVGTPQTVVEFMDVTKHGIGTAGGSSVARWDGFRVTLA